jgi:hypothetical protein
MEIMTSRLPPISRKLYPTLKECRRAKIFHAFL